MSSWLSLWIIQLERPLLQALVLYQILKIQRISTSQQIAARHVLIICFKLERATVSDLSHYIRQLKRLVPLRVLSSIIFDISLKLMLLEGELNERILLSKCISVFLELCFFDDHSQEGLLIQPLIRLWRSVLNPLELSLEDDVAALLPLVIEQIEVVLHHALVVAEVRPGDGVCHAEQIGRGHVFLHGGDLQCCTFIDGLVDVAESELFVEYRVLAGVLGHTRLLLTSAVRELDEWVHLSEDV